MAKATKIVGVYLNGTRLAVVEDPEFDPGGTPVESMKGIASGEIVAEVEGETKDPELTVTLADTSGLDIAEYQAVRNATIVLTAENGKQYTMGDAFYADHDKVSGSKWKVTFRAYRFEGQKGTG